MSSTEKLLEKLTAKPTPRNFSWDNLVTLLVRLGYQEIQGSGSRRKFFRSVTKHSIHLHKPHPGNNLKTYQVNQVIDSLINEGLYRETIS